MGTSLRSDRDIVLFVVLVVPFLVPRMINFQLSSKNGRPTQVVDRKVGAPLIFVFEECEAFALSRFPVSHEFHPNGLAVLREYRNDIAFGKIERQAANIYVGSVTIVGVP